MRSSWPLEADLQLEAALQHQMWHREGDDTLEAHHHSQTRIGRRCREPPRSRAMLDDAAVRGWTSDRIPEQDTLHRLGLG